MGIVSCYHVWLYLPFSGPGLPLLGTIRCPVVHFNYVTAVHFNYGCCSPVLALQCMGMGVFEFESPNLKPLLRGDNSRCENSGLELVTKHD